MYKKMKLMNKYKQNNYEINKKKIINKKRKLFNK